MKKGLIFDMDGTLWDSAINVAASWDVAVKNCGYERAPITEEEMKSVMGKTMDIIAERFFPFAKGEEQKKVLDACCEVENDYLREHGGVLYDNLEETLLKLKSRYNLYIVSNCQSGYIEAFLDYYKFWDFFEDIECYGNNGYQKGDNIALLAKRNNLDKAYYVGDIQGDYEATMHANDISSDIDIAFIHAAYGFGKVDADVLRIQSFEELLTLPEVN